MTFTLPPQLKNEVLESPICNSKTDLLHLKEKTLH